MTSAHRVYLTSMALFWLAFGLGTAFYPQMMQLFMTPAGVAATTAFSDHVWLHDGLDIISVCILLFALSRLPATPTSLRLSALVGLLPVLGIANGVLMTPYWSPLFVVPALGCFAFAVWGFVLSRRASLTLAISPQTP
jgi:hypothetical protein